jgi:hypothetical protein
MCVYKKGLQPDRLQENKIERIRLLVKNEQKVLYVKYKDSTSNDYLVNTIDSISFTNLQSPDESLAISYDSLYNNSIYVNTALNDETTYGVAKRYRYEFINAVKYILLSNHSKQCNLLLSGFNVNESNKYIRFTDIDKYGTKTDIARFYGKIPELDSKETAVGLKWLPLYHWGKFNPDFDSFVPSEFECGWVLVDLEQLYQQTLVPLNGYMDGTSGMVATYKNTGICPEKIKSYRNIPSIISASQQAVNDTFSIGAYQFDRVSNRDIAYNWQSPVNQSPYNGFDLIGGSDRKLIKPYTEKALVKVQYGVDNLTLLEAKDGNVFASKKNILFKVNADSLTSVTDKDIYNIFKLPIGKYTIVSIQRMEWYTDKIAFLWTIAKFDKNYYRCIVLKYNLENQEAKVAIEMPSRYTSKPSSWYSSWGYSQSGDIVVINDYGLQGTAGRVWVSENCGETFRCIYKMFDDSAIGETDSTFLINPPIKWETAVPNDATRNGNHVHGSAYDPYWDRIWVVQGDVSRDDIYENGPYSSIWYSDDWRSPKPTWTPYKLKDSDLKGIRGNKQFVGIHVLPECILFGSDNGEEMGTFRVNRTDKNKFMLDKGEIIADRNSGSGIVYIQGDYFKPNDDHPLYCLYFSHNGVSGFPTFISATWNGMTFRRIWTESKELTATWGVKICLLDKSRLAILCAGVGGYDYRYDERISDKQSTMYIIDCGSWEK